MFQLRFKYVLIGWKNKGMDVIDFQRQDKIQENKCYSESISLSVV